MPRIPPWLFRRARHRSPHVATLLPACRDVDSAVNELRWIQEYVRETYARHHEHQVTKLCGRRGRGEPLQYVLGSQPFGSLDISCKPGVLIPRSETEAYTNHLANLLKSKNLSLAPLARNSGVLTIIDFCTGTGCIPLLLFASLRSKFPLLNVCGVDVSPAAAKLARQNIERNLALGRLEGVVQSSNLSILQRDIFDDEAITDLARTDCDVIVSNPPYISKDVWNNGRGQLGYSVRKYEPRLALVPGDGCATPGVRHEDVFYARLLDIAQRIASKVLLLEIGDEAQALRVASLFYRHKLAEKGSLELWRDWPDLEPESDEVASLVVKDKFNMSQPLTIRGSGSVRSVFIQMPQQS